MKDKRLANLFSFRLWKIKIMFLITDFQKSKFQTSQQLKKIIQKRGHLSMGF
jgi:hypothetical protein